MKEIVFIVNSIKQARCIRRIEDFINNGYIVHVYGFDRDNDNRKLPAFKLNIIGEIENGGSYFKRIFYIRNKIKKHIYEKFNKKETVFYLFNFDVAFSFLSVFGLNKTKYIYEVSDLTELGISNKNIRNVLVSINKRMMRDAFENVLTSEGFYKFYFNEKIVENVTLLQNKLNKKCTELPFPTKEIKESDKIKIGFTGVVRYESIYNFTKVIGSDFPDIELHFFGIISSDEPYHTKMKKLINNKKNIFYHGPFNNPDDFPDIYSKIDLVLALYTPSLDVKYAEPNKLYEAIYYEKPIIVSKDTFLGEKVEKLNVGFAINPMDFECINKFLSSLTVTSILNKSESCKLLPKDYSIDDSSDFFKKIKSKL